MPPRGSGRSGRSAKSRPTGSSNVTDRLRQKQDEKDRAEAEARAIAEEANKQEAALLKDEGNELLKNGDHLGAVGKYSDALSLDSRNHILYSNRSAANCHLMRTRDAVRDAEMCTTLMPTWPKGWLRFGNALIADKQPILARQAFQNGLKIDNNNQEMKTGLLACEPLARAQEQKIQKEKEEEQAKEKAALAAEAEAVLNAEPVIGIDLGTTYSCVAWWGPNGVEIISDEDGSRTVPSYVGWGPNGEKLVGARAKAGATRQPLSTVYDVKRIIGQKFGDSAVSKEADRMPYTIFEGENSNPMVEVSVSGGKQQYAVEEISAMVLNKMKEVAEKKIGKPVKKAVITVPAYFNDSQRNATKNAGAIAGLEVLRIINEPTAAALAYGLDQSVAAKTGERGMNIMVFDLGGGTFDVSVLRIDGGVFEVKGTGGDTRLGGEDFDNTFQDYLKSELQKKHKVDVSALTPKDFARLKAAAERAKRELSSSATTTVDVTIDGEEYSIATTREKFENLNSTHFNRCLDTVKAVLKDAKFDPSEIDEIVLVGGSTRVPRVQNMLSEFFGGRQLCRSINPDEAVAFGAAVQGAILSGVRHSACQDLVLVDVTPLSLGIEVEGRQMSVIIPRNTPIPCKKQDMYTTVDDYEDAIDVRIFEGERPKTCDNHLLGDFTIDGIERAKRGEPKVLVSFNLDSNGILEVTAVDQKTEAKADCTISNACKGLSPEEIDRMLKEAEENARIDAELTKKIEIKSEIENLALEVTSGNPDDYDPELVSKAEEALSFIDSIDAATCALESLKLHHRELSKYMEN